MTIYKTETQKHLETIRNVEIGRRLRQARLSKNLTQSGLAERIGITSQQVQKYEIGTDQINALRMAGIGSALNVPFTYFFDDLEQMAVSRDSGVDDDVLPDRVIRLARKLNDMPDGNLKDQIFLLIKSFSEDP